MSETLSCYLSTKMKVKPLSHVWLLATPMDCSLPGYSVHGIFQARVLEWVSYFLLQGIFLTQGSTPGLLHCTHTLYPLSHQGELDHSALFKQSSQSSLVAQMVNNLPATQETWDWSLGQKDPPEKGMAAQSSILAWTTPWTEEPGRLPSMGSQRVGQDWAGNTLKY